MACNGCGSDSALTKSQVENLLSKLIRELGLADEGKIKQVINDLKDEGKLVDGSLGFITNLTTTMDGKLKWKSGGEAQELDVKAFLKNTLKFGATIKEGAVVDGIYDVDTSSLAGKGLKQDPNNKGKLMVDTDTLFRPTTEGVNGTGSGTGTNGNAGSGLRDDGNGGLQVNPADFIDNTSIVLDPTTNRIKVANKTAIRAENLNDLRGLGQTLFTGFVCNNNSATDFVLGVPVDIRATTPNQNAAQAHSELAPNQCYDFNGVQIASAVEVHQTIMDGNDVWVRSNGGGMNEDGTLKDPNGWTEWNKADNIPLDQMDGFDRLVNRVSSLENRLNQPCVTKITLKAENYTPVLGDELLIFTGGQTVTFADDAPVGKQWTIVNDSENALTLASDGEIIPPFRGSLKVKGKNAAVTVVKTAANQYRVFGQTENA